MRPAARVAALGALLLGAACAKFETLPPDPVAPIQTRVLLHRGSGSNTAFHQNTALAVIYGSIVLDGAEFDLQLSADGTLWLGHDNEVHDCSGALIDPTDNCFQDLTDAEVEAVAECPDGRHYDKLETVLQAISKLFPEKLYSFDIKGQYCGLRGIPELMGTMASETDRLVRLYEMDDRVETESDSREFLGTLQSLATPVHSLVVALNDVDGPLATAAEFGAAGISLKYDPADPLVEPLTKSLVDGLHGVGYRIAVWTIDPPMDIAAVWATGADVIQTDTPDFYSYVPE